jgi:hypothetical protein
MRLSHPTFGILVPPEGKSVRYVLFLLCGTIIRQEKIIIKTISAAAHHASASVIANMGRIVLVLYSVLCGATCWR